MVKYRSQIFDFMRIPFSKYHGGIRAGSCNVKYSLQTLYILYILYISAVIITSIVLKIT